MLRTIAVAASVVAVTAPFASALLELVFDLTDETFALDGAATVNFSQAQELRWFAGAAGGSSRIGTLVLGTHYTMTPSTGTGLFMQLQLWDDGGISLLMNGIESSSGYVLEGLSEPRSIGNISQPQIDFLLASDGQRLDTIAGSSGAPLVLSVVPAPSALALFGVAGLAASRRRR